MGRERGGTPMRSPIANPSVRLPVDAGQRTGRGGGKRGAMFKRFGYGSTRFPGRGILLPVVSAWVIVSVAACSPASGGADPTETAPATPTTAATATSEPVAAAGVCANPLYPAVPAALWSYRASGGPDGEFDYTSTIDSVSEDGFIEKSVFGGLTKEVEWRCGPEGLTLLSPNGGVTGSVSTGGTALHYVTTGGEGVTLPVRIAAGDSWTQSLAFRGEGSLANGSTLISDGSSATSFRAAGIETVVVPAGSFDAMRIDVETKIVITTTVEGVSMPLEFLVSGSVWYAPGVGTVKNVSTSEGMTTTIILTSYTIP